MITLEKLRVYQEFDGDIDGWARASKGRAAPCMSDADWYLINELLTGLTIIETGLASSSFVREVEAKCAHPRPTKLPVRHCVHSLSDKGRTMPNPAVNRRRPA
jgi:hypothetical protein